MDELTKTFGRQFVMTKLSMPEEEEDDTKILGKDIGFLEVKADTVTASLSAYRAVLFQKGKVPFTKRDLELRKIILALYPHSGPTPFPWEFRAEPNFDE